MRASPEIYLDSNAASKLKPDVRQALAQALDAANFSNLSPLEMKEGRGGTHSLLLPNPSSSHQFGQKSKKALIQARNQVARSLGVTVSPEEVYFTSSGTEASQTAIRSALESALLRGEKVHWITTQLEHEATHVMARWIEERGGSTDYLPADSTGAPRTDLLSEMIRPETRLVSSIWVNNETGVITDIASLSRQLRHTSISLHLDGAQAWGKTFFDLHETQAQWVSFSGQKIGALAGTGVLWSRARASNTGFHPLILGKQENQARGGTENLLGIVSLGAAASCLTEEAIQAWQTQVGLSRDRIESRVKKEIAGVQINGAAGLRVVNTTNFTFDGVDKPGLVAALDLMGYAVSSGSACSSGIQEPSRVLMTMGRSRQQAMASIRISLGEELSEAQINGFVQALAKCVKNLRSQKL